VVFFVYFLCIWERLTLLLIFRVYIKKKNTSHRVIFNLTKLRLKINPKGLVQVARALVLVTFPSSLSRRFESPLV